MPVVTATESERQKGRENVPHGIRCQAQVQSRPYGPLRSDHDGSTASVTLVFQVLILHWRELRRTYTRVHEKNEKQENLLVEPEDLLLLLLDLPLFVWFFGCLRSGLCVVVEVVSLSSFIRES